MLVAIDVGNTNTVLGVFRLADWELIHSWRLTTLRDRTVDELGILVMTLCERHGVTRDRVIGRTTVGSIQSGLYWGYVEMVEGLVRRMRNELGGNPVVVATGGLAVLVSPDTPSVEHVDMELTLRGLRIVWERNRKGA